MTTQMVRHHGRSVHKRSTIEILIRGKTSGSGGGGGGDTPQGCYSHPHRFEKYNYTTPSYCDHCTSLLWGPLKVKMCTNVLVLRLKYDLHNNYHLWNALKVTGIFIYLQNSCWSLSSHLHWKQKHIYNVCVLRGISFLAFSELGIIINLSTVSVKFLCYLCRLEWDVWTVGTTVMKSALNLCPRIARGSRVFVSLESAFRQAQSQPVLTQHQWDQVKHI